MTQDTEAARAPSPTLSFVTAIVVTTVGTGAHASFLLLSVLWVSVPHCSTSPCRLSAPPNGSGLSGLGREGAKEEDLLTLFQQLHFFMSRSFTLVLQIHIFFKISYYEIDHT